MWFSDSIRVDLYSHLNAAEQKDTNPTGDLNQPLWIDSYSNLKSHLQKKKKKNDEEDGDSEDIGCQARSLEEDRRED